MTTKKTTPKPRPQTNAERQARWRDKRNTEAAAGRAALAGQPISPLRNANRVGSPKTLRNDRAHPEEDRDAQLTILRQRRDQLRADDLAFIKAHGLSEAERATLDHQLRTWREDVQKTGPGRRGTITRPPRRSGGARHSGTGARIQ
jgi:hypothetical protein